MKVSVHF